MPRSSGKTRALDVGCAVGRSALEMSRVFDEVVGVDYSHAFIDAAKELVAKGRAEFSYTVEGAIQAEGVATVPSDVEPSHCVFEHGDACDLDIARLGKFHVIHGANLLCRLPEPKCVFVVVSQRSL